MSDFVNEVIKDINSEDESNDEENNNITNISNIISNEELIFNPYNNNNKEIQLHNIIAILSKYGIFTKPFNIELYKRAFIHRSYTKRPKLENEQSNIIDIQKAN